MPILIALYACLFAHLNVSKSYEDNKKIVAYCIFALIAAVYILFRVVF